MRFDTSIAAEIATPYSAAGGCALCHPLSGRLHRGPAQTEPSARRRGLYEVPRWWLAAARHPTRISGIAVEMGCPKGLWNGEVDEIQDGVGVHIPDRQRAGAVQVPPMPGNRWRTDVGRIDAGQPRGARSRVVGKRGGFNTARPASYPCCWHRYLARMPTSRRRRQLDGPSLLTHPAPDLA